jgi:hypothetical protein
MRIPAILLWEPNGPKISVKPYDIEPEELLLILNKHLRHTRITLAQVKRRDFCFSSYKTNYASEPDMRDMAKLAEGADFDFNKIGETAVSMGGTPTCPY